jgi:hypothetical protein
MSLWPQFRLPGSPSSPQGPLDMVRYAPVFVLGVIGAALALVFLMIMAGATAVLAIVGRILRTE